MNDHTCICNYTYSELDKNKIQIGNVRTFSDILKMEFS